MFKNDRQQQAYDEIMAIGMDGMTKDDWVASINKIHKRHMLTGSEIGEVAIATISAKIDGVRLEISEKLDESGLPVLVRAPAEIYLNSKLGHAENELGKLKRRKFVR
ncbi:hypothetical protein HYV64_01535 [Candidatus Shapirobacteria bacterium]|nr:hypothetical protein [Candidatus Shapirobacteria bacterium]